MIGHSGIAEGSTCRHHGAGKQLRFIDAARDIGGLEAGPASLGKIARLELGFAEIAKQLPLDRIVPGALERKRRDRIVEVMRRFLIGELLFGGPRRLPRIFDRRVGVAGRRALTIVVRDLGIGLSRRIETTDRFRDDAMQTAPLGRRERVVKGFADQGMAKAVASRRAADLVDEFKRSGLDREARSIARAASRSRPRGC